MADVPADYNIKGDSDIFGIAVFQTTAFCNFFLRKCSFSEWPTYRRMIVLAGSCARRRREELSTAPTGVQRGAPVFEVELEN